MLIDCIYLQRWREWFDGYSRLCRVGSQRFGGEERLLQAANEDRVVGLEATSVLKESEEREKTARL